MYKHFKIHHNGSQAGLSFLRVQIMYLSVNTQKIMLASY
jgi:hypothetical protein